MSNFKSIFFSSLLVLAAGLSKVRSAWRFLISHNVRRGLSKNGAALIRRASVVYHSRRSGQRRQKWDCGSGKRRKPKGQFSHG
ncbi:MAG TPA: hypothetical protein VF886_04575, partial [Roseiarcus sp.]